MKKTLTILSVALCTTYICGNETYAQSNTSRDTNCFISTEPPEVTSYLDDMRHRFYRNLSTTLSSKDVSLTFFLTEKGLVRDARISKSSGNKGIDSACLDAVYCASPLPAPPTLRTYLKAPPEAMLYAPNEYGEGVYSFTFRKSKSNQMAKTPTKQGFEFRLIPKEVEFRYPGLFTEAELNSDTNKIQVDADSNLLESMRIPWSLQYRLPNLPTKADLVSLSRNI